MIKFIKLSQRVEEAEYIDAIIAYKKSEYKRKEYPLDYMKNWTSSDNRDNTSYVSQYRKYLYINLWFIILKFKWLTKEITIK